MSFLSRHISSPSKLIKSVISFSVQMPKTPKQITRPTYRHWLLKAEPESRLVNGHDVKFSIDDLKECSTSPWDGVRNYEARNNMKAMKNGDLAFFYHSNCKVPGIVGIMRICKQAYPDYTAVDKKHPYHDAKSDAQNPKWFMVDVEYVRHLKRIIPLVELKENEKLKDMALLRRSRLSITGVKDKEWEIILEMERN